MLDLDELLERLARVHALYKRPGTEGERRAAQQARQQILAQLAALQPHSASPPPVSPPPPPAANYRGTTRTTSSQYTTYHGPANSSPVEFRFQSNDESCRCLMEALLRRHGFTPHRNRGVRSPTILATLPEDFTTDVLWPEYNALVPLLQEQVAHCIRQIVADLPTANRRQPVTRAP